MSSSVNPHKDEQPGLLHVITNSFPLIGHDLISIPIIDNKVQ